MVAAAGVAAVDRHADVAGLVGVLEHRLHAHRHVVARLRDHGRRHGERLARTRAFLDALMDVGRLVVVGRADHAHGRLPLQGRFVHVHHAALAERVLAHGGVRLEADLVLVEPGAFKVEVHRAAAARRVLRAARTAGERADRPLDDLYAFHEERIHEQARATPDRQHAVERRLRAAHAADGELSGVAHEKRLAARLDARHVAQKIVEIGGIVFADVVLREGVHHRGQLFGRCVGEGGAADGGGAVAREGGAFHEDRAEVGDFVRGRLCGRMRTDENGREECG